MNLKEAFQTQNKLKNLLEYINDYLLEENNIMTITEKHLKGKASTTQLDEKIDASKKGEENYDIEKLLLISEKLLEEKEKLSLAVNKAKANMAFDLDVAVDTNKTRHAFIEVLKNLAIRKNFHRLFKGVGEGYVFNKDGNQTAFRYDIDRIYTIDYDRNKVKNILKNLQSKAEEISLKIDTALLTTTVDVKLDLDLQGENRLVIEDMLNLIDTAKR